MGLPLTQHELDDARCGTPGCRHANCALTLRARCHPTAATWATYDRFLGILKITCAHSDCGRLVAEVAVAP